MNLKLFIIMGVPWLVEILGSLLGDDSLSWILTACLIDIFNLLHGVFMFFIFVFKRSILEALQKKFGMLKLYLFLVCVLQLFSYYFYIFIKAIEFLNFLMKQ